MNDIYQYSFKHKHMYIGQKVLVVTAACVLLVDPVSLTYIREYPLFSIYQWGYSQSTSTLMLEIDMKVCRYM